jgi:hypothetical protein
MSSHLLITELALPFQHLARHSTLSASFISAFKIKQVLKLKSYSKLSHSLENRRGSC